MTNIFRICGNSSVICNASITWFDPDGKSNYSTAHETKQIIICVYVVILNKTRFAVTLESLYDQDVLRLMDDHYWDLKITSVLITSVTQGNLQLPI